MKKHLKLLIAIVAIIVAGSYASCNKLDKKTSAKASNEQLKIISASLGFSDFPTVEDGMLKFRDDAHYSAYMDFLDAAVSSIDSTDTVNDEHSILQQIEDGLDFKSLRNITHTEFMTQNETGWSSIEAIPDEHFLVNADIRSVLNSDLDVQIGDNIIHYVNKDYVVSVDAKQAGLLDKFHRLPVTASIDDIMDVDLARQFTSIQMLSGEGFIWDKRRRPDPVPLGDWNVMKPYIGFRDPCNNPHLATFRDIALYDGYQPALNGNFLVDFGDGSSVTKTAQPIGVPEFTHLYATAGNYTVTITAYIPGSNIIAVQRHDNITVLDGGCKQIEKNSGWYYTIVGTKAVSGNIYIHKVGGIFGGSNRMRVDASTRSMEYNNGQWSLVKGKIGLHSICSIKDVNCNQFDVLEATDEKSKSKEFTEHRTSSGLFYWSTASCEHYIIINGTKYTLQVSMSSCQ